MNKLAGIVIVAAALAGCKKESSQSGDGAPERDGKALWKLAPEGTQAGFVIAAGAGAELHRGFIEIAKSLPATPLGAEAIAEMTAEAKREGVDPMSADGFKSIGIDPALPLAVFIVDDEPYGIVPVSDPAAFSKKVGATSENGVDIAPGESACQMVDNLYRCARTPEKLAAWKPAAKPLDDGWPTELRGSIEFYVGEQLLAEAEPIAETMESATALRGAVRIERGAALLRFRIDGKVKKRFATGETPLADAAKTSNPAALLTGYGQALIDLARAEAGPKLNEPGPGGITPAKLFDALTGELVAFAPSGGEPRGFIEIGIRDPEPFKALKGLCSLAPPLGQGVAIKTTNDGCSATLGPPITPMPFDVDVKITDEAIVAALGNAAAGREGKGPALPKYFAGQRWLGSMWLRGSILSNAEALPAAQIEQMIQQAPQTGLGLWAYAHLSELGFGLRTDDSGAHGFIRVASTWRNPPEVVAELEPLIARFSKGELAVAGEVKKLADKHGGSPLAADMKMGASGGAAGAAGVGVLAAVAIPAFVKYQKRAAEAGNELAFAQLEQLKVQMCACADSSCAASVAAMADQWMSQNRDLVSSSPASAERVTAIIEGYTQCMTEAMSQT